MPEGDTFLADRGGHPIAGRRPAVLDVRPSGLDRLRGTVLEAVDPLGKHLLMRFFGGWTLHSHMRMSGSWHLYPQGGRWRRPAHTARAVLDFGEWVAVCFSAPVLELVRNRCRPVEHLGPDILAAELPVDAVVADARAARRLATSCSTNGSAAGSGMSTGARCCGSAAWTRGTRATTLLTRSCANCS